MNHLEQAKKFFSKDRYATEVTGIVIEEADVNYAKCSLEIEDRHLNAAGTVMGGAIFTLADLTFGVAANIDQPPTVSLSSTITYLGVCKGKKLIATAKCEKSGMSTCSFTIHVTDELGTPVAVVSATGFRKTK